MLALLVTGMWAPVLAQAQAAAGLPYFAAEDFPVSEKAGVVTISVRRDSSTDALQVTASTKAGSATAGEDFQPFTGPVFFGAGDAGPKTFQVVILDDTAEEDEESLLLTLSDSSGMVIDITEVIIESDEVAPELQEPPRVEGGDRSTYKKPEPDQSAVNPGSGAGADNSNLSGAQSGEGGASGLPVISFDPLDADEKASDELRAGSSKRADGKSGSGSNLLKISGAILLVLAGVALVFRLTRRHYETS